MPVQAGPGREGDGAIGFRGSLADRPDGQDETALAEADRADQDGAGSARKRDDVTGTDITGQDGVFHRYDVSVGRSLCHQA
jgi:hypothetical protein